MHFEALARQRIRFEQPQSVRDNPRLQNRTRLPQIDKIHIAPQFNGKIRGRVKQCDTIYGACRHQAEIHVAVGTGAALREGAIQVDNCWPKRHENRSHSRFDVRNGRIRLHGRRVQRTQIREQARRAEDRGQRAMGNGR